MMYTKIKISDRDFPSKFYRVIAVQGDPDLYTLGALIGNSLNAWFEHFYLFRNNVDEFIPDMWNEYPENEDAKLMSEARLSDLGEKFEFEYDTGEDYVFNCRVMKNKVNYTDGDVYDEQPYAFVIEGKGQGIFENDHHTLWRYLSGKIDPNLEHGFVDDEGDPCHLPMNMEFEKFGDFDEPLDLDFMVYYKSELDDIAKHFKEVNGVEVDMNEDYDEDDDIDDFPPDDFLNKVAGEIFNNPFTNEIFRELIKKHDINEAYEMICASTLVAISTSDENDFDNSFDEQYEKCLNELLKK